MHVSTDLPALGTLERFAPDITVLRRPREGVRKAPAMTAPATARIGPEPALEAGSGATPVPPPARANRLRALGQLVRTAIDAALGTARRVHGRYRQRRRAKAAYDALSQLDDHMLRDLGFARSELASVVAELTGAAAHSRVRDRASHHDVPK
jgi:uncharacterized protein YjiS (DUF1127 family)